VPRNSALGLSKNTEEMKLMKDDNFNVMITSSDYYKIQKILLEKSLTGKCPSLEKKLETLQVIEEEMPKDIVKMNSNVFILDHKTSESYRLRLVFDFNPMAGNQASVLSPLGAALLGSRLHQEVTYETRDCLDRKIRILEIL
jgi:transcription elongation GreA/GreB family factor